MERVCHGKSVSWKEYVVAGHWSNNRKTVRLVKEFGGHSGMNMRLSRLSS
jgi:hypothetical protein